MQYADVKQLENGKGLLTLHLPQGKREIELDYEDARILYRGWNCGIDQDDFDNVDWTIEKSNWMEPRKKGD